MITMIFASVTSSDLEVMLEVVNIIFNVMNTASRNGDGGSNLFKETSKNYK